MVLPMLLRAIFALALVVATTGAGALGNEDNRASPSARTTPSTCPVAITKCHGAAGSMPPDNFTTADPDACCALCSQVGLIPKPVSARPQPCVSFQSADVEFSCQASTSAQLPKQRGLTSDFHNRNLDLASTFVKYMESFALLWGCLMLNCFPRIALLLSHDSSNTYTRSCSCLSIRTLLAPGSSTRLRSRRAISSRAQRTSTCVPPPPPTIAPCLRAAHALLFGRRRPCRLLRQVPRTFCFSSPTISAPVLESTE